MSEQKMARECWAKDVSPCRGDMTGEHVVSECMLGKKLDIKGLPWCMTEYVSVGKGALTANILCERHNGELSPTDAEGKLFADKVKVMMTPKMPGNRFHVFDGFLLARWMCKTHCNMQVVSRKKPGREFVFYAFGKPIKQLHFFVAISMKAEFSKPEFGRISMQEFSSQDGDCLFIVNVNGFNWICSNFDLSKAGDGLIKQMGIPVKATELMDRPTIMWEDNRKKPKFNRPPSGKTELDWSNEVPPSASG